LIKIKWMPVLIKMKNMCTTKFTSAFNLIQLKCDDFNPLNSFNLTSVTPAVIVIGLFCFSMYLQYFYVFNSLFTWSKQKWLLWRDGFYPANQNNLKSIQRSLIGWKKVSPLKMPLLFWSCKQATSVYVILSLNVYRYICTDYILYNINC